MTTATSEETCPVGPLPHPHVYREGRCVNCGHPDRFFATVAEVCRTSESTIVTFVGREGVGLVSVSIGQQPRTAPMRRLVDIALDKAPHVRMTPDSVYRRTVA